MSSEALAWAFKQNVKPSAVKFTLVAMSECANYKTGDIHPSIEHLVEITGQDRKTIIANIAKLEELGLLVDTGERSGRTRQIKVYRLSMQTVPNTEQSQMRNSSVSPSKQSQKRDTEPSKEPSTSEAKASSVSRVRKANGDFVLPSHIPGEQWAAYVEMRAKIRKPMTAYAMRLAVKELDALAADGWPPGAVLDQSTMNDWQGLFPLKVKPARDQSSADTLIERIRKSKAA